MNASERASDRTASPARGHAPVKVNNAFVNHSSIAPANGYYSWHDEAQLCANTYAFHPPSAGYMYHEGAYDPWSWYSPSQQAIYAGHYDYAGWDFGYSYDPTQLQPQLLPQFVAMEQQYHTPSPPQYTPYYGYDFTGSARNFRERDYDRARDQMRGGGQDLASTFPSPKTDLFIFHVPEDMTDEELSGIFSDFGKLKRACVQRNGTNGSSRGYGFVTYEYLSNAIAAVENLNNFSVRHKFLSVTFTKGTPRSSDGNGGGGDRAGNRKARRDKRFGRA